MKGSRLCPLPRERKNALGLGNSGGPALAHAHNLLESSILRLSGLRIRQLLWCVSFSKDVGRCCHSSN